MTANVVVSIIVAAAIGITIGTMDDMKAVVDLFEKVCPPKIYNITDANTDLWKSFK